MEINPSEKKLFREIVRFECRGCGACCKVHGKYAYVYLTTADRRRLARHLGLSVRELIRTVCVRIDGHYYIGESKRKCRFLEGNRCSIYPGRPHQCRSWPFWPDNLDGEAWMKNVRSVCPGAGPVLASRSAAAGPEQNVPGTTGSIRTNACRNRDFSLGKSRGDA